MSVGELSETPPRRMNMTAQSRPGVLERRLWRVFLFVAWVASMVFVAWHLNRGWVPHDDGALAQSAQRVLDGQLPHRDFTELYTGGLTFLNAGVFWLFGQNLIWLRIPMFLLFVAYVPCVYALARRFAPPLVALLAAAFAVTWGPATYPAAVPSWYLLFFSVFGALALLRHLETGHARWLVVAGVFGGLSISVKIVGVWCVIAVVLFLIFVEQETHRKRKARPRLGPYGLMVAAFACLNLALVVSLLHSHLGVAEIMRFLVPVAALCGFVIANEMRVEETRSRSRLSEALRLVMPFLIGVAAPLVALLVPYAVTGSVGDILFGVLIEPQSRLEKTYLGTPDPVALLIAAPVALVLVGRCFTRSTARRVIDVAGIVVLTILLATWSNVFSYTVLWTSARELAPFVVIAGLAVLVSVPTRFTRPQFRPGVFLLLALATFSNLVQFPFGQPIYFCYVAPLFALAAIASLRYVREAGGLLPVALLLTYVLFGLVWLDRGAVYVFFGAVPHVNPQAVILDHRNASIRVRAADRAVYRNVSTLLRRHASGRYAYAGPDAPEVYFLSSLKNPTRSLFDVLDTSDSARGRELLRTLRAKDVNAVAINLHPEFSEGLDRSMLHRLRREYPSNARVGKFDVRWRAFDP